MAKHNSTISLIATLFLIMNIAIPVYSESNNINSATESDQDIILVQQLIELDTVQLVSNDKLSIRETLIFKNIGDKDFYGTLRTWVPDGIEGIKVGRVEMVTGSSAIPMNSIQTGNIISWNDSIKSDNPLPPLYAMEYISKSKHYSKKLVFPTLINKVPVSFILKVTKSNRENIVITDEKGSNISSGEPAEEGNSILYKWENPGFKEINIDFLPAIDADPIQPSNQIQADKQIKELQERLNQTEAKQAQQEKRLSWLEEKMNLIIQWLRSIIRI